MAKRKRLSPAALKAPGDQAAPETKALIDWVGTRSRAPVADVSGDAAMQAAFEDVAGELHRAKSEGRMVVRVPLEAVKDSYLVRDRMTRDVDEMASLTDSLRARGQQTPIEVVDLGDGRYGLISGWRRMQALRQLHTDASGDGFSHVQALIRAPDSAADAYCAMVEENEIRADLSFYERAHIAVKAAEQGVYTDIKTSVQSLFSASRPPKRSKIMSFTGLVIVLGDLLHWPETIPEKLGLSVAAALKADPKMVGPFRCALSDVGVTDAYRERAALEQTLRLARAVEKPKATAEVVPGVALQAGRGKITLAGRGVDAAMLEDLRLWLAERAKVPQASKS